MANFLKVITKEAAKVEATLEDLFSFVEERDVQLAAHQLYSLLRRCVMVFYTAMKNGNITYQFDLPGKSPTVMVDGDRIRQVFLHLMKNAIEAMPGGGVLYVGCTYPEDEEGGIDVIIQDSGTGITDDHLQHVTDPFFTTKTYGTGMGLTLVEKLTAMHGATFQLAKHESSGMTATVSLPAKMIVAPK
jgi:signal transduction histidine kinase